LSWALADVKSTIAGSTVTLQPTFITYANNPGDPYWQNGAIGNKNLELKKIISKVYRDYLVV
jgi:hypothetical protein